MTPDTLGSDLYNHLFFWLNAVPALERRQSHWVMSTEWSNECRKLAMELGSYASPAIDGPDYLLGIPIEIRDDGGVPHLEITP